MVNVKNNKVLKKLLLAQLILVFFQLGLRQFLDNTLLRDFFLILIIVVSFLSTRVKYKSDRVSRIILWLVLYGIIILFVHSFTGPSVVSSITEFRNFFLPFLIVPIFRGVFLDGLFRLKYVKLCYYLFIIIIVDIYVEYFLYLFGVSRDILPWYSYQYTHLYRFTTSPDPIPQAVSPENAPILGLFGWPLNSSATLLGLFSFIMPWLFSDNKEIRLMGPNTQRGIMKYIIIPLFVGALLILQVKTTIFAFFVVLLLYFNSFKKQAIKVLPILVILFVLLAALTKDLWVETIVDFQNEIDDGEIAFIFNPALIGSLINSFMSGSVVDFMFGADFSHIPMFEDLEIRLIYFTFTLGVIWLILFGMLIWSVIVACKRLRSNEMIANTDRVLVHGIFLSFIAYLIDMLHYANMMYLFNIFFISVLIALLSSLTIQYKKRA